MPRLAPPPLLLTEAEQEQLQQLVNRHSTPQQIALRASICNAPRNSDKVLRVVFLFYGGTINGIQPSSIHS